MANLQLWSIQHNLGLHFVVNWLRKGNNYNKKAFFFFKEMLGIPKQLEGICTNDQYRISSLKLKQNHNLEIKTGACIIIQKKLRKKYRNDDLQVACGLYRQ